MATTRRNFLAGSAIAAAAAGLAACSGNGQQGGGQQTEAAYPLEPEEFGSGEVHYTIEEVSDRPTWYRVANENGATLGAVDKSMLIQVDGLCFKDMNGNGKLDLYEDWRQDADARSADIASQMDADEILPEFMVSRLVFISGAIGARVNDDMKALADSGQRQVQGGYFWKGSPVDGQSWSRWSNQLQAYAEGSHLGIPMHVYADPFNSPLGEWPGSVGLAATFDPEVARSYGFHHAQQYRAIGVHTVLGPQMDTATEPRWSRAEGTFGEDPALSRDMAKAEVEALQTTYDANGEDQGWGAESVVSMVKHWPGDGAGMFGWESHNRAGRYSQFDGGNFDLHLIPFVDGAFKLDSSTVKAAAVMPSYSIAYSEDGEWGENVGSAFSEYKISLLRDKLGYDELICTDWQVVDDGFHHFGVDNLTPGERVLKCWKAGVDQIGGQDDLTPLTDGYRLLKEELGEEEALATIRSSIRRVLRNSFRLGLFENVYLDPAESAEIIDNPDYVAASHEASVKSIVMLKNDGVIARESGAKPTVYVPKTYTASSIRKGRDGDPDTINPSTFVLPGSEELFSQYFNLVTDSLADTLTGDPDDNGDPMIAEVDIIRATPEELASCDFALVIVKQPQNAHNADGMDGDKYIPVSLQYGSYTADAASGCPEESFCGSFDGNDADVVVGPLTVSGKENLSPFGNSSMVTNTTDLDLIHLTAVNMPESGKIVVCVNSNKAGMIPAEFESEVNAILYGFNASIAGFLDIVSGKAEPSGLLPIQLPKDMKTVETQLSDTPRDMECYVDAAGNSYDFGFGLNWSGVIDDERTATYCVAPIMKPETSI